MFLTSAEMVLFGVQLSDIYVGGFGSIFSFEFTNLDRPTTVYCKTLSLLLIYIYFVAKNGTQLQKKVSLDIPKTNNHHQSYLPYEQRVVPLWVPALATGGHRE